MWGRWQVLCWLCFILVTTSTLKLITDWLWCLICVMSCFPYLFVALTFLPPLHAICGENTSMCRGLTFFFYFMWWAEKTKGWKHNKANVCCVFDLSPPHHSSVPTRKNTTNRMQKPKLCRVFALHLSRGALQRGENQTTCYFASFRVSST